MEYIRYMNEHLVQMVADKYDLTYSDAWNWVFYLTIRKINASRSPMYPVGFMIIAKQLLTMEVL